MIKNINNFIDIQPYLQVNSDMQSIITYNQAKKLIDCLVKKNKK